MIQKISVKTRVRTELCDITKQLREFVAKGKIHNGILHVYCPHTTAALTINENCDPSVQNDISNTLNKLVPEGKAYSHAEGNADAHVKSAVVGPSVTLFIENGDICLGTWQGIYLCEFDGPRNREVWTKITKE
jgi:secondary thiamine-phosphate synthase enzyme